MGSGQEQPKCPARDLGGGAKRVVGRCWRSGERQEGTARAAAGMYDACVISETPMCYSFVCNKTSLRTHERLQEKQACPIICTNMFACILLRYSFENSAKL